MMDEIRNLVLPYHNEYCTNTIEDFCELLNEYLGKDYDKQRILYQILGDFYNKLTFDEIFHNIENNLYGWKHKIYTEIYDKIEEQDNFLINPFEVEEGVLECRCGSRRVFSYGKQVRSSDEGTTVFANCVECGASWVHSG